MPWVRLLLAAAAALGFTSACLNHPDPASPRIELGAAGEAAIEPVAERGLQIATFNVHMKGAAALARAIRADRSLKNADVIMLQEIEWPSGAARSNAAELASLLGMDHAFAPGYGLPGGGSHGVAILSRRPIKDVRVLELPRHHTVVNSARRVALAATITTEAGPLRLWTVHLDNRINPAKRAGQLRPVLEAIEKEGWARVVLAGDLNTSPFCWLGHIFPLPCGIQARRLERDLGERGFSMPTRGAGATSKYFGMSLDAIYVRGMTAVETGISRTAISDHFPLWVRAKEPAAGKLGD